MFLIISIRKKHLAYVAVLTVISIIAIVLCNSIAANTLTVFNGTDKKFEQFLEDLFEKRNQAILDKDFNTLKSFYNRSTRLGTWAYEHQVKKVKYLHNWAEKQGVRFTKVKSNVVIRRVNERNSGFRINFSAFTKYSYSYKGEPSVINSFKIGTYHSMDISEKEDNWIINREWYTDPFADSLNMAKTNTEKITEYILSGSPRDFSNLNERRKGALEYADKYCGTSVDESHEFKYNKKYRNYNYMGGDCANFASQVLHEGGKFKKNYTWNYDKEGSKAWVNANAFKSYLLYSGRASLVARGTYEKVLKASYKLLPGDIIAYEKKGKVAHVSVVTGADSKGYTLVNCHNTDRYRVPWDLGWSNKGIKFWLIHVHY